MRYFSRITVQPAAVAALQDTRHQPALQAGDVYRDHALIWQLFPEASDATRDFLFRAEQGARQGLRYYLVSARPPQSWHPQVTVETRPYLPTLAAGDWVQFELRANPVIAVAPAREAGRDGRVRGKRHDVLMHAKTQGKQAGLSGRALQQAVDDAAAGWLLKRADKWGLAIADGELLLHGYQPHRLHSKGRDIRFASIDYQGIARVSDPLLLQQALLGKPPADAGLGHAQGFGCGLLLVKRLP